MAGKTEEVLMTATKVGAVSTIRIERVNSRLVNYATVQHIAAGPYKGIVINKSTKALSKLENPHICMSFIACMTDARKEDSNPYRENRELRFWFKGDIRSDEHALSARAYFAQLLTPEKFPKESVYFIKKAVTLVKEHSSIQTLDVVIKPHTLDDDAEYELVQESVPSHLAASAASTTSAVSTVTAVHGNTPDVLNSRSRSQENLIEEVEEEQTEGMIANYITVLTPACYDYQYLPEVPVSTKSHVAFRIKSKADAHIALSSVYGDTDRKTYEVVIGDSNNSRTVIRDGGRGDIVASENTREVLDPDSFESFWVSWAHGKIQIGHGMERGQDKFMEYVLPENRRHAVNCMAVSSGPKGGGEWEFVEYIDPTITEANKASRKAKMKRSLLWLAKKQKMLLALEDAYPNSLNTMELLSTSNIKLTDMMTAVVFLREMQGRGLIKEVNKGIWIRSPDTQQDTSHVVKMVQNIPVLTGQEQPTIAVVTAMYCEKPAADAMMQHKTSYVRYKT